MTKLFSNFRNTVLNITIMSFFVSGTLLTAGADMSVKEELREARLEGVIWTLYHTNEHLIDDDIDIEVNGKKAVLTGHVDNDLERTLAKHVALGLDEIDKVDNRLKLDPDAKSDDQPGIFKLMDNASTTAAVKTKLMWHKDITGTNINVDTTGDVVILDGTVNSESAHDQAIQLAKDTSGVNKVVDRLKIADTGPTPQQKANTKLNELGEEINDVWLTTAVKTQLLYSDKIKGSDISVDSDDGLIRLKGEVPSDLHRDLAISMASNITGVKDVDASMLKVQ